MLAPAAYFAHFLFQPVKRWGQLFLSKRCFLLSALLLDGSIAPQSLRLELHLLSY